MFPSTICIDKLFLIDVLARLDPERIVLTGGYSLELRLPKSRSTTDIDLYIRDQQILSASEDEQRQAILYALRQQAENEIPDHFLVIAFRPAVNYNVIQEHKEKCHGCKRNCTGQN
jgi:hypothetical protein